jgi:hypothetical protein
MGSVLGRGRLKKSLCWAGNRGWNIEHLCNLCNLWIYPGISLYISTSVWIYLDIKWCVSGIYMCFCFRVSMSPFIKKKKSGSVESLFHPLVPSWNRIIYGASRRGSATGPHPGRSVRWDSLRMGIPKAILDHRFWWVVDLFLWKMMDFVKWFFIVQFPIWMESYNPSMVQTTKRVSIFVALILWFFPGKKTNRFESIPNDLGYKYIKLHLWNIMYSTIVYSRIIYTKK